MVRAGLISQTQAEPWDEQITRGDIRKLPFADNTVDGVYSSHVLEHIYLSEAAAVLRETHRVLRPGAVVRIALPDAAKHARELLAAADGQDGEAGRLYNQRLLAFPERRPTLLEVLKRAVSGHIHRWQPTPGLARLLLEEAGFVDVARCAFRVGALPQVEVVETRENSFFLEATKP